jgi:hypothetical protein
MLMTITRKGVRMRGPIDYIIVGFEGPKFDGSILKALQDALDSGVIGLVGLTVIRKDADGLVSTLDLTDTGDQYMITFAEKYHRATSDIDNDDIDEAAELLENDTAAGLLVIEHLWAKPLKAAIAEAGGVLVAEGRIHPEAQEQLSAREA